VPAGTVRLEARRVGFAPRSAEVVVPAGGTASAELALTTSAAALSEVVVTGAESATAAFAGCWELVEAPWLARRPSAARRLRLDEARAGSGYVARAAGECHGSLDRARGGRRRRPAARVARVGAAPPLGRRRAARGRRRRAPRGVLTAPAVSPAVG